MNRFLLIILPLSFIISCSSRVNKDGKHCAEIDYYNPKTGTHSEYTLPIEVEEGELVKIYFTNGGWLDESHFDPPNISDGTASFISDKGYEYDVEILEDEDCD